ncbi:hypothetical protein L211DRAFT_367721 [Terfezia boudieri ATCC MYA-4762]|uniref:Uncharacterized protein n=1 Tax=Terfezia boudieri ATCC MYA-4762 TaxID=1051890 RepID=A0A3N4MI07_9PEZI|nr:hypothetical protein L211DRAFT_367721 [Terfezia boudieri ATCC MYA-4762]
MLVVQLVSHRLASHHDHPGRSGCSAFTDMTGKGIIFYSKAFGSSELHGANDLTLAVTPQATEQAIGVYLMEQRKKRGPDSRVTCLRLEHSTARGTRVGKFCRLSFGRDYRSTFQLGRKSIGCKAARATLRATHYNCTIPILFNVDAFPRGIAYLCHARRYHAWAEHPTPIPVQTTVLVRLVGLGTPNSHALLVYACGRLGQGIAAAFPSSPSKPSPFWAG